MTMSIERHDGKNSSALRLTLSLSLAGILVAGCAGPNPAVEKAGAAVEQVRSDPDTGTHAPVALQRTEEALSRLSSAAADGAGQQEIDHLAYLVERRADVTRLRATTVGNWRTIEELDERRETVLLEAEKLETAVARQEATSAIREAQDARKKVASLQEELKELEAKQTDRGLVVTLGDLLFDVDGAKLKPGGLTEVERVAQTLIDHPDQRVEIEGHTDSTGAENYNLQLSEDRATAVREVLIGAGVPADQIAARGYGESYPVATNDSQSGRQQNRRVELIIQGS